MKSHALFTLTVFCRLSLSSENAFDDLKECGFAGVFFSELADGHVRLGVVGHQTLRDVDEGILEFIHALVVIQARGVVDHQLKSVLAVEYLHIEDRLRSRLILAYGEIESTIVEDVECDLENGKKSYSKIWKKID